MSSCFDSARRQRGDVMLEALVGVLITSLIGAGLAHVAANVMNSQRDAKVENLVVEHLRDELQGRGLGLCAAGEVDIVLPDATRKASIACEAATANVTMAGISRAVDAPPRVELKVAASALGSRGAGEGDPDLLMVSGQ